MICWIRSLLSVAAGLLCITASQSTAIDDVVRFEASSAIRWEAFWEGTAALGGNYKAGSNIDIKVIHTQDRLYAIMGPLHMILTIAVGGSEHRVQSVRITNPPGKTNAEAAEWFFQTQEPVAMSGCFDAGRQQPSAKAGTTLPIGRPCVGAPGGIVSESTVSLSLPALTPPDAIRKRTVPANGESLISAVQQYVESRVRICGPLKARVPFYSDTDPRIYVLVSKAGDCPRGVATFSRAADSRWEFGKFIADLPMEQISGIIAKVEPNTAVTVP